MLRLIVITFIGFFAVGAHAAERVDIVIGKQAPAIEKLAASELAGQFERLFDVKTATSTYIPKGAKHLVLIGTRDTNSALGTLDCKWPQLSDQGILLRSFAHEGGEGIVVTGGSPVATLWSVYELGHRFGVRYLLRDDVFPKDKQEIKLDGFESVHEPVLRTRTWRTMNDFPIGPESWSLDEHKRVLRQLAKLKFNDLMIQVYPWQPFVHYEFRGVKKQTATLWYGDKYRVDGDTPGKTVFRGAKFFENPHFVGKTTYQEKTGAGIELVRNITGEAKRLGMSVGIAISPLEFPKEFEKALPGAEPSRGLNNLCIRPGAKQKPDDPALKELVLTKLDAYLKTYSKFDSLYLTLPEFPAWNEHAEVAWEKLSKQHDLGELTLEKAVQIATKRDLLASGKRGEEAVRGNVVGLAFLDDVLKEFRQRNKKRSIEISITQVDPALYPVLDKVVPDGSATLNFVDYTARRTVENRELLSQVPARKVRSQLIMTLADDNVGVLSQSATRNIATLASDLQKHGWDGFSTRYWQLGELDPTVYFLSRAAWDKTVTARSAHDDLFTTITGKQSASDRLWLGFGHIEDATNLIDKHDIGFAFPVKGMLMKHYRAEPEPKWWAEMNEHYTQAMIELYRSRGAADARAQPILYYYAKRSEYVLAYLGCLTALREAAIARKAGDDEKAIEQFETAIESMYNAIDHLVIAARDNGDRGLIAVLTEYAYRPLVAEYEKLLEATEQ